MTLLHLEALAPRTTKGTRDKLPLPAAVNLTSVLNRKL